MPLQHLAGLHRPPHADFRASTARGAHGMRTPRSAPCTSAPFSTCARDGAQRCAPLPRKRAPWCASTRAHSRASMAMDWCAANGSAGQFGPRLTARVRGDQGSASTLSRSLNPGKIVRPSRMDDRRCSAFLPITDAADATALDWSGWDVQNDPVAETVTAPGTAGIRRAASARPSRCATTTAIAASSMRERCARAIASPVTKSISRAAAPTRCGSRFPASLARCSLPTTRRAALDLCVSCKGCRRECPTGVDMAKMKIEFMHHYQRAHGLALQRTHGRPPAALCAAGPRPAVAVQSARHAAGLKDARRERGSGFPRAARCRAGAATRSCEVRARDAAQTTRPRSCCFVDTFNQLFRARERARRRRACCAPPATRACRARTPTAARPLCCGRTFLAARAGRRSEKRGAAAWSQPWRRLSSGVRPIIGLEPSCLLDVARRISRDAPGRRRAALADRHVPVEEFLAREHRGRTLAAAALAVAAVQGPAPRPLPPESLRRSAASAQGAAPHAGALGRPDRVELLRHGRKLWLRGGALRHFDEDGGALAAAGGARRIRGRLIVADGTSCRHQIDDGTRERARARRCMWCACSSERWRPRAGQHSANASYNHRALRKRATPNF